MKPEEIEKIMTEPLIINAENWLELSRFAHPVRGLVMDLLALHRAKPDGVRDMSIQALADALDYDDEFELRRDLRELGGGLAEQQNGAGYSFHAAGHLAHWFNLNEPVSGSTELESDASSREVAE